MGAARVFLELVLLLAILLAILVGTYRISKFRQPGAPAPELDVSRTPSEWFTDSRTTDDGMTEVCVVRVEQKTGLIRERRVLRTLDNDGPNYKDELDKAMDDAYETMRILNVNLRRR
jgi:hypothetical protein